MVVFLLFAENALSRRSKCPACRYPNRSMHQSPPETPSRCQAICHHKMEMEVVRTQWIYVVEGKEQ